jgi:TetR/AcrR family transcriptional regulator, transcriptional repressor for nem operon
VPRDGSQTRQRLLDTAEKLVERNGFAATSVDQILEASGSSKGAFFHHFASKRALAHALVGRYVDADLAMLRAGLDAAEASTDPVDRLLTFLRFYENWSGDLTSEAACLYIAVITERDLLDEQTAAEVERAIVGWRVAVADLVRAAYDAAGVTDGPDPEELADQLFVTFEGAYLVCRALDSPEPMRSQLRVFRQLVQSLLRR